MTKASSEASLQSWWVDKEIQKALSLTFADELYEDLDRGNWTGRGWRTTFAPAK